MQQDISRTFWIESAVFNKIFILRALHQNLNSSLNSTFIVYFFSDTQPRRALPHRQKPHKNFHETSLYIFIQIFIILYYRTKTNHDYQHQISPAMFTKEAKATRCVRQTAVMGIDVEEWRYSWRAGTHTGLVQANMGSRWISSVWCLADKTMSISIMSSINVDIIKQRIRYKVNFCATYTSGDQALTDQYDTHAL